MTRLTTALAAVEEAVNALKDVDVHGEPADALAEAMATLERIDAKVTAARARVVAQVEADGVWTLGGARSMQGWVRTRTGRFASEASALVRMARGLRDHLPATAEALADGEITMDHAQVLVRHALGSAVCRERLTDESVGEAFLLEQARRLDAAAFNRVVKVWAMYADPAAADDAWRDDAGRESFSLARTMDGWSGQLWLSETNGALVEEALRAIEGTPQAGDMRTAGQRRAAALVEAAGVVLDSGAARPKARIRPALAITADLATLQAVIDAQRLRHAHDDDRQLHDAEDAPGYRGAAGGQIDLAAADFDPAAAEGGSFEHQGGPALGRPGESRVLGDGSLVPGHGQTAAGGKVLDRIEVGLDYEALVGTDPARLADGTPIPFGLFAQLLCEAGLYRVIFGAESEVLDVGREKRLFTRAQTRGILARDGGCRFPGCTAPAGIGEIHHALYFAAHGGETNTGNGVLLCRYHHSLVHRLELTIERRESGWWFLRPDGRTYGVTRPSPSRPFAPV